MGEKSCPLIAWQTKKRSFYTPLFCSQHFMFLFQHTEYIAVAIRFASCYRVFLAENPRALFFNLCTL